MLRHTFQHLPGIGAKTEQKLWNRQIVDWQDLIDTEAPALGPRQQEKVPALLKESRLRLQQRDPVYFEEKLPASQHWRLFPEFRDQAVYLDIETNGLDPEQGQITTIALYDGRDISCFIHGHNLDAFLDTIRRYSVIITYNGKCFDIPYIETFFQTRLPHTQIDLRYVLASLGYKGGLKACEKRLGIDRGDLQDVDGLFAVLLWREYQRNRDPRALETLLAYNAADAVNLETLMVQAFNMKLAQTPFSPDQEISLPSLPTNPYLADPKMIRRIQARLQFQFSAAW